MSLIQQLYSHLSRPLALTNTEHDVYWDQNILVDERGDPAILSLVADISQWDFRMYPGINWEPQDATLLEDTPGTFVIERPLHILLGPLWDTSFARLNNILRVASPEEPSLSSTKITMEHLFFARDDGPKEMSEQEQNLDFFLTNGYSPSSFWLPRPPEHDWGQRMPNFAQFHRIDEIYKGVRRPSLPPISAGRDPRFLSPPSYRKNLFNSLAEIDFNVIHNGGNNFRFPLKRALVWLNPGYKRTAEHVSQEAASGGLFL
ncbi:hypothetical protein FA95DRAFT_1600229 [Auriscalpium vulgare]|uniref:Uncharacterized protein n=1 Tax=Auriscalpium vulgare TaxID=40419 RepID=A0ACB8R342_9AGAM|nr:hypothetical protein FA95DRAFT_1600229 [Auriscalpium vulgare]